VRGAATTGIIGLLDKCVDEMHSRTEHREASRIESKSSIQQRTGRMKIRSHLGLTARMSNAGKDKTSTT
jgi:hypothetical protein